MLTHPVTLYWHQANQLCSMILTSYLVSSKKQLLPFFKSLARPSWGLNPQPPTPKADTLPTKPLSLVICTFTPYCHTLHSPGRRVPRPAVYSWTRCNDPLSPQTVAGRPQRSPCPLPHQTHLQDTQTKIINWIHTYWNNYLKNQERNGLVRYYKCLLVKFILFVMWVSMSNMATT